MEITRQSEAEALRRRIADLEQQLSLTQQAGVALEASEQALVASEAKYRTLFESLDEGFCIIEVLFDDSGTAYDYRFLEVNAVFERHTGLSGMAGRTIREFVPNHDEHWFRIYGAVALTGVPERFQNHAAALGRWFDVYAFRIGAPNEHQVAVLFNDITARKRREANVSFLAAIADDFARLSSADEIMQTVGAKVGTHLGVTTCIFCEVDENNDEVTVNYGWSTGYVPSLRQTFRLSDYLTPDFRMASRAGQFFIVHDTETDPRTDAEAYARLSIRSFLTIPFHDQGTWRFYLAVTDSRPRRWRDDEIELFQEPSNRVFPRLERARAEAQLRQQWHTFDTALSHTPDFTYIFDLEGRFTYVNRALLSLWQKPLEEARGKNFFELEYPHDLAARLQRQIQEVIETQAPVRDITPFTGPTGDTRFYEYIFVPVLGANRQVEAVAGSTRDITERKRMEQALAASKERLQQVFRQAPVAIAVFRGWDYIVELANPAFQALLQSRELLGRRFIDVAPELTHVVWDAFAKVMETGEAFVATDFFVHYDQNGDGVMEDHWFNLVYQPFREADENVSGIVAVCSEVTPQVMARQQLERVNRDLEQFAFVASHDLQEPLRMVNIYTQLLLRRFVPDQSEAEGYAAVIQQGVTRMETLIRDLLTYSRTVQTDDHPPGKADLSAALTESLSVLNSRIEESGAIVTAEALPAVRGDTAQFAHIFQNLLSNALK